MSRLFAWGIMLGLAISLVGASTCDCGWGTVLTDEPCLCSCTKDYIAPNCMYKANDDVPIVIVVADPNRFTSYSYADEILAGSGIPTLTYQSKRLIAATATLETKWLVKGSSVAVLVQDINTQRKAYATKLNLTSAAYSPIPVAPKYDTYEWDVTIYEYDRKYKVTLLGLVFLLAAIFLCLCLPIADGCFLKVRSTARRKTKKMQRRTKMWRCSRSTAR